MCVMVNAGCESALVRQVSQKEQIRDYEAAIDVLKREVQQNPHNAEAQFHLGRLYFTQHEFVLGREALLIAMDRSDRFDEKASYLVERYLHRSLASGIGALESNDAEEAVTQFRFATQIDPASTVAYRGLGQALYNQGNFREAEAAYEKAAEHDLTDVEVRLNLSELALRRQDYPLAIQYAREALALQPGHPEGLKRLAYASMLGKRFELADSSFQQYISMPSGEFAVRDYAFMSFNAGRYEVAIPHLVDLAEQGDADGKIRFMLGEAYFATDRFDDMAEVYEHLMQEFPEDVYAIQGLIVANERLGNVAETLVLRSKLEKIWDEKQVHE